MPELEILPDADAFEFQKCTFFVGGTFTPLTDIEEELGEQKVLELRSQWVYGRVTARSGHECWLRHGSNKYHLWMDCDGKLVVPEEHQEREIIRKAHLHILYGQLSLDQAIEVLANCQHQWRDHDEDLGGNTPWECIKCGLGYAISPDTYGRWEDEAHRQMLSAWPEEVRRAGQKFPALIHSGINGLRLGRPQQRYATPAVPGYMSLKS